MKLRFEDVIPSLQKHILVDGFHLVLDSEKSRGSILVNGADGQPYLDFFSFFASLPLGFRHSKLEDEDFHKSVLPYVGMKPTNSDVYSTPYAEFVEKFHKVCIPQEYVYSFYIEGGTLAVENALKVAFDWKVRKNIARGHGERGHMVLHFKEAFHGRSGYSLSLTNTSGLAKTLYFPKFGWPRVTNPKRYFPENYSENVIKTDALEAVAKEEIISAFDQYPHDISCIIIEPIQGEGGDNYFRPEFLQWLRKMADEREALLIFDEVQTGFGGTGNWWAFETLGVKPDIVCFGKKTQVCGVFANRRIDDVDNCFKVPSRINSTFGGGLLDMIRASRFIDIIQEDQLLPYAANIGPQMVAHLSEIAEQHPQITNIRGQGTWVAFDLPDSAVRDAFYKALLEKHYMVTLKCGVRSIRLRTSLCMPKEIISQGAERISRAAKDLL